MEITKSSKPRIKRFGFVKPGEKFEIFAEPTRRIRRSTDKTVYVKQCDAFSTSADGKKDIILYPNDLVSLIQ